MFRAAKTSGSTTGVYSYTTPARQIIFIGLGYKTFSKKVIKVIL